MTVPLESVTFNGDALGEDKASDEEVEPLLKAMASTLETMEWFYLAFLDALFWVNEWLFY